MQSSIDPDGVKEAELSTRWMHSVINSPIGQLLSTCREHNRTVRRSTQGAAVRLHRGQGDSPGRFEVDTG